MARAAWRAIKSWLIAVVFITVFSEIWSLILTSRSVGPWQVAGWAGGYAFGMISWSLTRAAYRRIRSRSRIDPA